MLLRSFISSANSPTHPFPLNNLPFGIFTHPSSPSPSPCIAIGDLILSLAALVKHCPNVFSDSSIPHTTAVSVFCSPTLNAFLTLPRTSWLAVRALLQDILSDAPKDCVLKDAPPETQSLVLFPCGEVVMHLPVDVGDYTDFYSSRSHAENIGTMFRGKDNALPAAWLSMPIAYHGRASSVVVSGTGIKRPCGQLVGTDGVSMGKTRLLDFELEMATVLGGVENPLGQRVTLDEVEERVFGFALMNDWSARDIQKWEYVPLGPFGGKNFGTTIGCWIVMKEALEDVRVKGDIRESDLEYLRGGEDWRWDVELQVGIKAEGDEKESIVCESNFSNLWWTVAQQVVHHAVTGCNLRAGDLLGSGTISGESETSYGSMLELCWKGTKKIILDNSNTQQVRTFLKDGDTVYMHGAAKGEGYTIGFGECSGKVLP